MTPFPPLVGSGYYIGLCSKSPLKGEPLPPPMRRRRLWMAPRLSFKKISTSEIGILLHNLKSIPESVLKKFLPHHRSTWFSIFNWTWFFRFLFSVRLYCWFHRGNIVQKVSFCILYIFVNYLYNNWVPDVKYFFLFIEWWFMNVMTIHMHTINGNIMWAWTEICQLMYEFIR